MENTRFGARIVKLNQEIPLSSELNPGCIANTLTAKNAHLLLNN